MIRVHSWLKNCGRIGLPLLGFILLAALPLRAQDTLQDLIAADKLRVTARLDPAEPVIATQRTKLVVEIATPTWFAGGTRLGDLPVRNAIVLQRQTFGNNSSRRINGQTWAVQGWEFEIFPRYPGTYEIPGVEVSVQVAGEAGASVRGETITAPLTLEALAPPVEPPAEAWVVSPDLSVRTSWDQPLEDLVTGNARQRTITITAEELPSMVIPAPTYGEIDGIGIYPQPARRDDQTQRGQSTATFSQTVSYFCESPGTFTLPGFTLAWWNPESNAWRTAEVPSETFVVVAGANAAVAPPEAADPAPPARSFVKRFLLISTGLLILALILRSLVRAGRRLNRRLQARALERKDSEPTRWKALQHALHGTDARAMMVALYRWRDTLPGARGEPTLQALAETAESPELAQLFDQLLALAPARPDAHFSDGAKIARLLRQRRPRLCQPKTRVFTLVIDSRPESLN